MGRARLLHAQDGSYAVHQSDEPEPTPLQGLAYELGVYDTRSMQ